MKAEGKKTVNFMKKAGAPTPLIKQEKAEHGLNKGGKACYAGGGYVRSADGVAQRGKTRGKNV